MEYRTRYARRKITMTYPENPRPGVATSISLTPASASIAWGATVQLTPTLSDVDGNPVEATQPFAWATTNRSLATVSDTGLCTASSSPADPLSPGGVVTISCTYPFASAPGAGTISAASSIAITPAPVESVYVNLLFANQYGVTSQCPARVSKVVPQS